MKLPIPLTVLTGFLGSGKTTLLKALLAKPDMAGTAVIVNEFGDVGLDDALIESAKEETVLLPSGCVCCAVRILKLPRGKRLLLSVNRVQARQPCCSCWVALICRPVARCLSTAATLLR